jgi:hypothetical protein
MFLYNSCNRTNSLSFVVIHSDSTASAGVTPMTPPARMVFSQPAWRTASSLSGTRPKSSLPAPPPTLTPSFSETTRTPAPSTASSSTPSRNHYSRPASRPERSTYGILKTLRRRIPPLRSRPLLLDPLVPPAERRSWRIIRVLSGIDRCRMFLPVPRAPGTVLSGI